LARRRDDSAFRREHVRSQGLATGTKVTVAAGFALIIVGLITGMLTRAGSGYGFAAVWITVPGVGRRPPSQ
jgi:hypothetical protein